MVPALSGPAPDTPDSRIPITGKRQLVEFLEQGCKPRDAWRIGTEHEKFPFLTDTLTPVPYDGPRSIRAMLEGLRDRFGWTPIIEAGNIIGLNEPGGGGSISLEPGGQFELSGALLGDVHETCLEVHEHLAQVREIGDALGIGFLGLGFSPLWTRDETPVMPKGRYAIMQAYMAKTGKLGQDMMFRSCTVQVNLDFGSESDMVKKMRVSLALQPIATALFANSPFTEARPNGFLSLRSEIWRDTDPDRTGMLPFAFEDGFGFERYVDYTLDVPMYFVYRDGTYHDVAGSSFREFMANGLPQLPGVKPMLQDWSDHLTTIFPEVRLKRYLEMRGADSGQWRRLCALARLLGRVAVRRRRPRRRLGTGQDLDGAGTPGSARRGATPGARGRDRRAQRPRRGRRRAGARPRRAGTARIARLPRTQRGPVPRPARRDRGHRPHPGRGASGALRRPVAGRHHPGLPRFRLLISAGGPTRQGEAKCPHSNPTSAWPAPSSR
jgi:glutamate--cysteine ligase